MQELEKILEEIKSALKEIYLDIANNYDISDLSFDDSKVACVASKFRCTADDKVEKIINKHIFSKDTDITNKCGDCSRRKWYQKGYDDGKKNDGWIPAEERLPEKNEYFADISSDREFPNGYYRRLEIAYMTDTVEYTHGYYDGYKWMDKWNDIIKNVVAWKIHDPYRPERSEE